MGAPLPTTAGTDVLLVLTSAKLFLTIAVCSTVLRLWGGGKSLLYARVQHAASHGVALCCFVYAYVIMVRLVLGVVTLPAVRALFSTFTSCARGVY